ncbi:MAG TPA: TonB-dependent receptor [Smithellaceae bacterium]|nr:TonB-dependent receptor [Smithellaceae bacterium]
MKKVSKSVVVLCLILFIIHSVFRTIAASGEELQKDTILMDEVVVTATKTPEKRKDIPNAMVIMDQKDIQASGAKSVGELLANEPGIDWQTYGNYGGASQEIHIRGMKGNATQVLVNGVNVGSASLGVADVGKIPLESVERIEIVKGAGSLLYGSGAMAGTVNIFTKNPSRDKMDLRVAAGYGTQGTYRLAAENGMFVLGDFGYYLTAGRTETDGFRDNAYLRQNDVSLKLLLDKGNLINVSLYGDYIDRDYGVPGVKPPAGTADYFVGGERFYNSDAASLLNHSSDKDGHVVLNLKGRPIKWIGYDVKGYYTNMDNYNYTRYDYDGSGAENWITNKVLGTDGHLAVYPVEGAKVLLGGEYEDFNWKNFAYNLNTAGLRDGSETTAEAHVFTQGYFTEAEYRPFQYGKIFAGFRHEKHSAFGSENLPLVGVVINPLETTALKVSHGKHFLAPTLNDLYWPADPYTKGNPDLNPEVGWHTDVTIEQSLLKDKVFITLSYFRWNVDDKIQWEPDSQGVFSPINLAGYKADGFEAGVKIGPFHDLTLALNYTYTNAEEENRAYTRQNYYPVDFQYTMVKRRATMTPENQFKGDLIYKSGFGLTATATARYVGDRVMYRTETTVYPDTTTVTSTLGSYWTADLKLEQRLFKNWILSVSAKNLFDKEYDTHLSTFTDQTTFNTSVAGYPGAGRSVYAGVAYEF